MNTLKIKKYSVWIGLATVVPIEGNNDLGDADGAIVNILHWAKDKFDFEEKVKIQLTEYGYTLVDLEDIELFDFGSSEKYRDNLGNLAQIVVDKKILQWGTFYTFDEEE